MFKKLMLLFGILLLLPVQAGELENALNAKKSVFLYITAPWCGACKAFNPTYQNLEKQFGKQYTFIKVDADSKYGYELGNKYRIKYIPYVRIFKADKSQQISSYCLLKYSCVSKVLSNF